MNIFVAGASGAIGRPLLAELIRQDHAVTGMTNSDAGARVIAGLGAAVARVSAFDAPALERALQESRAEVVIDVELLEIDRTRFKQYGIQLLSPGNEVGIAGDLLVKLKPKEAPKVDGAMATPPAAAPSVDEQPAAPAGTDGSIDPGSTDSTSSESTAHQEQAS